MTLYTLLNLKRRYGARTVLDIDALDFEEGKIYALLGPNGAGKTTLLNILAFLDVPTSGSVYFRSQKVRFAESVLQGLRKSVVMVDQHPILFSTSVYKNVEFGLKIRGIPKSKRDRIVTEALDLVGMRRFSPAAAHRLSGGETQRVALARALALSPQVFLCDEPTSGVDMENRGIVLDILRRINAEKNISVIFTTHDRGQAASLTPHILSLEEGSLAPSVYENVFTGIIEKLNDANYRMTIRNCLSIDIPQERIDKNAGPSKLYIDPAGLKIIAEADRQARINIIDGKVFSAEVENDHIRLVVDAGVFITLHVSGEQYRGRQIMVGDSITLSILPEAIHLL